jgi:hypothetical protein
MWTLICVWPRMDTLGIIKIIIILPMLSRTHFLKDKMLSRLVHCNPESHYLSWMNHTLQQSPDQNYNSVQHYHPLGMNLGLLTHQVASDPSGDYLWNCFHSSIPPSDCQVYLRCLIFCCPCFRASQSSVPSASHFELAHPSITRFNSAF